MEVKIDATVVDAWTEFIRMRDRGAIEYLDEYSRNIIYAVAAAEARGEKISKRRILRTLRPKTHSAIANRITALTTMGWLAYENDPSDSRVKNFRLTPKSIAMVNLFSDTLKRVVKERSDNDVGETTQGFEYE